MCHMDVVFFSSGVAAEVYEKRPGNDSDDIDISKDRGRKLSASFLWIINEVKTYDTYICVDWCKCQT